MYLLIEGVYCIAHSTAQSPQGFSQIQISHKLNTIQNMKILYKPKTHNPKVGPFGIARVKKGK